MASLVLGCVVTGVALAGMGWFRVVTMDEPPVVVGPNAVPRRLSGSLAERRAIQDAFNPELRDQVQARMREKRQDREREREREGGWERAADRGGDPRGRGIL